MSNTKDYYQILGITPSADVAVMKAVYKALALKFHPDRNKDNPDAAAQRMKEINEAYTVLSDEQKRAAYDQSRRGSSEQDQFEEGADDFSRQFGDIENQIEADWVLAKKYYPELDTIVARISKISSSLVLPFKIYLLETKAFADGNKVADKMIDGYLKTYFGNNQEILDFSKYLLKNGHRAAARELNKAVKLFGKTIDSYKVINAINDEYNLLSKQGKGESHEQGSKKQNEQAGKGLQSDYSLIVSVIFLVFIIIFLIVVT